MNKRQIIFTFIIIIIGIVIFLWSNSGTGYFNNKDIFKYSHYRVESYSDSNGELNIALKAPWLHKKVIELETKNILYALKKDILAEKYENFKGIRIIYKYELSGNKIYEIYLDKTTLLNVDWYEITSDDIPNSVKYVYWDRKVEWEDQR